ncbi:MAG: HPP family protein [Halobacteria archaeon]|nr:HPP family protein [Halobacteria archaeon]
MPEKRLRRMREWLSDTSILIHVSSLFFVLLVIFAVVEIGIQTRINYLIFPPLASATFTLFYDSEGIYSEPRSLVGGLTIGAAMGWLSFHLLAFSGSAAALAIFLTGVVTWVTHTENPTAYSTYRVVRVRRLHLWRVSRPLRRFLRLEKPDIPRTR